MLYIFTGNGKGKTTAALGQAMRAVGEGKRVLMVQFIKGPWKSGEDHVKVIPSDSQKSGVFQLVKMGKGFVGILGDSLPRSEHKKAAQNALSFAKKEARTGKWDMIILDEVNNALSLHLVAKKEVLDFINNACAKMELIVCTGRDAPQELLRRADLITMMQEYAHPYQKGIKGKRGIEY